MERQYLIAYSRADEAFAHALAKRLGDDEVHLKEVDLAASLWEEFVDSLSGATEFVVLWSWRTKTSRWALWEFNSGFLRLLRDCGIAVRLIRLDDAPVPAYLSNSAHDLSEVSPESAAAAIQDLRPPGEPLLPSFVDRWEDTAALSMVLRSSQYGLAWVWGMPGIGKSTFVAEALKRVLGDSSRIRCVNVRLGTRLPELSLLVTAAAEADSIDRKPFEDADDAVRRFAAMGGIWVFEDAQHWLDNDARPNQILTDVFEWLERETLDRPGYMAVFTATRKPRLDGWAASATHFQRLEGLLPGDGADLLHICGLRLPEPRRREISRQLYGHPLALELAAGQNIDVVDWEVSRVRVARDMLADLQLEPDETLFLETLAIVDGPLPDEQLAEHLGWTSEKFHDVVFRLVSYFLLTDDPRGFLTIHPLVQDFFVRGFRHLPDRIERIGDLAERSRTTFDMRRPGSVLYVQALETTYRLLLEAHRRQDAYNLRTDLAGVLYEAAEELYQQGDYYTADRYLDQQLAADPGDIQARCLHARALAHLKKHDEARRLLDDVLEAHPNDRLVLQTRARIENIAGDPDAAARFIARALDEKSNNANQYVDVAIAQINQHNWDEAEAALTRALDLGEETPLVYKLFARSLRGRGNEDDYARAVTYLELALRDDPKDDSLLFDLGKLHNEMGDRRRAVAFLRQLLERTPDHRGASELLAQIEPEGGSS